MKRRWNLFVWAGFLLSLAAFLSYFLYFNRFPVTRDFPWLNLLLFAGAGYLLGIGLKRAFTEPELYRGKVSGAILGTLAVLVFGLFLTYTFYLSKQVPASKGAPHVGQKAPEVTGLDQNSNPVTLAEILTAPTPTARGSAGKVNGVLLIFYRGYW